MSRVLSTLLLVLLIVAAVAAWLVLGAGTGFSEKNRYFLIAEGKTDQASVLQVLEDNEIIAHPSTFSLLASQMNIWSKIRPGKYEVKKGMSNWKIVRMLRNGRLAEIKLVINKLRTKEDLAKLISKNFAPDSVSVMRFLNSKDSLKPFGVDTSRVFTLIIPDTYSFYWHTSLSRIFSKLADAQRAFWLKNERMAKAEKMKFTPEQVYILASIVEEETNYESDKYKIASVYINRLQKQMPLQACPTIKYAMKDFTITRIYEKYLFNPSPYNTYRVKGLPPGPICTPSPKTIDIVLNAPASNYLYFVAKSDFSGYHHFSSSYAEHDSFAKQYQKALDAYMARKQEKESKKP